MATYHFKCYLCGKVISARTKYFKKYLQDYFCINAKELSEKYICKNCKVDRGEKAYSRSDLRIQAFPSFVSLKRAILVEAKKLLAMGLKNEYAKQNFAETVKVLLDQAGVRQYTFIIEKSELKGILLRLPFIGIVTMKLNLNENYD
jgi:hypothetical protein